MLKHNLTWYQNILIIFCFFVFYFPFRIYGFDPRVLVFILYFILILQDGFSLQHHIKRKYILTMIFPFMMLMLTIFTNLFNINTEPTFIIFPFQIIYLLILSYCVFYITKRYYGKVDFYVITQYFLLVLILQSVIAIIMFVNEPICSFLFDLQGIDQNSRAIQMYLGMRLIGVGCFYFGAGAMYGLGLMSIMPLLFAVQQNKHRILLMLLYAYLFVVGIFFARTALVGAAVSVLILFSYCFIPPYKKTAISIIRHFAVLLLVLVTIAVSLYNSSPKFQEEYGDIVNFGFEAFINLTESGEFTTKSSDGLKEYHLNIWPESVKTYYIGDTRWTEGDSYYGDSDVGYIRLIYYFGIPGIILFLLYQYMVSFVNSRIYKQKVLNFFFISVFFYSAILLIKGYTDTASLLFIYLHFNNENFIYS